MSLRLCPLVIFFVCILIPVAQGPLCATTQNASTDTTIEMETTQDTPLYYAPGAPIGTFKTGTRVKLLKTDGDWAFVKHVGPKVIVQGWVAKAHLITASDPATDPLRGLSNQN